MAKKSIIKNIKKISIFSSITILFSVLFSAGVITLVTYSFLRSEYAIEELAERLNNTIAQQVKQEFKLLIEPADNFFEIIATLSETNGQLDVKSKQLGNILLRLVTKNPQLYNLYIAFPDGSFIMSTDSKPTKLVYIEPKKNNTKTVLFNPNRNIIKSTDSKDITFKPSSRPWYKGAMKTSSVFVTDVYNFFESQKPGVTLSRVIKNKKGQIIGVVGADLLLTNLQEFLSTVEISKNSFIAIIDKEKGKYIVSKNKGQLKEDSFEMVKLFHKFTKKQNFDQVEFKNEMYYFTESDVGSHYFKTWRYMIAIPETELINEILIMRQQSLWVGLLILIIGCIIIFLFSKLFSKPIKKISNQANRIKELEQVASLKFGSPVEEVSELIHSINALGSAFDSFIHYVPKTIVKHLLETNQKAGISGEMYHVTILFTDIEGFTEYSDDENPENVSVYLSEYFELLSEKVPECGGTIDKYIGDSLMAFWGAPIPSKEHATKATEYVINIKKKLESKEIQKHPVLSRFKTRFALHSGHVVIGNIGSSERFNYTAIGRDVNICARLEALNKKFGTYALISDETKNQIGDKFITRPLEPMYLKGVREKIMVHELLNDSFDKRYLQEYQRCNDDYINRNFQKAREGFEALLMANPGDKVLRYFLNKIDHDEIV
ncbi:hypothetical protein DID74_01540 [Candidatus Marinamargulisbacteria bacterium SCGC AG-333-B06]|nr:hypothetical protein DID74_01540 [Candidatus Marinamargulisbacteria bacterium SCGC AG-333-B06]